MPPALNPDLAVARIRAAVLQRVSVACPGERALASQTLDRVSPDRWALEWHLPSWVGRAFGLDAARVDALVTGNVLGLISLRLEDDLRDRELHPEDVAGARRLSPALLDEAIATYRAELPPSSPFWPFVSAALSEWRAAQAGLPSGAGSDLVGRAAPVRIPAHAVCLLTDRLDAWPALDRCLGHALTALVRYDQLMDWEKDLDAGRWNSFVAAWSPGPQDAAHRAHNQARVRVALLTGSAASLEYARVEIAARAAEALAARLEISPLAAFLARYADRTAVQGDTVQRHYDGVAERAVEHMFGSLARA